MESEKSILKIFKALVLLRRFSNFLTLITFLLFLGSVFLTFTIYGEKYRVMVDYLTLYSLLGATFFLTFSGVIYLIMRRVQKKNRELLSMPNDEISSDLKSEHIYSD